MISYKSKGPETFRSYAEAEAARVTALIERDQADRQRDQDRRIARGLAESGNFERLDETVMEPTPEWEAKGDAENYTPRTEDGTVRTVKTRRRIDKPLIRRMWNAGRLTDEQYAACSWYRDRHDCAGLDGRYKSSHISLTAGTSGGGGGDGQSPMALHEYEAQARIEFRAARAALPAFYLRFFEAVVLGDVPLRRAGRFAHCPERKVQARFRSVIQSLTKHLEASKIEVKGGDDA